MILASLQRNKTGALIEWSAIAGAVLSDNSDKESIKLCKVYWFSVSNPR